VGAQDPHAIIFDVNNGLPSSEVYDIEIDKFGNIWFSTDRGVSRYNGYEFKNFTTEDGLTDNTIFEICKDHEDRLWFCCYNGTVCYYDYKGFFPASFNDDLQAHIKRNWVRQIYFDEQNRLVFYTEKVISGDTTTNYFKYDPINDSLEIHYPDKSKDWLVFGNSKNSFVYSKEHKCYSQLYTISNDGVVSIGVPKQTKFRLYQQNNTQAKGISEFSSEIFLAHNDSYQKIFEKNIDIVELYTDGKNELWLISDNGLINLEKKRGGKRRNYLRDLQSSSMLEDEEKNVWIATNNKGVVMIPEINIEEYPLDIFGGTKLLSMEALPNHLIISDYSGRIFSMDLFGKIEKLIEFGDQILDIRKYKGEIYLYNNSRIAGRNNTIKFDQNEFSEYGFTKVFLKIDENHFFKSLQNLELYQLDANGELNLIKEYPTETRITSLSKDDKRIWIGTLDGIYWLENFGRHDEKFIKKFDNTHIGRVSRIYELKDGIFFICTVGQGIFIYNEITDQISSLHSNYPNPVNIIHCLYAENDSIIWIGTNKGLFKTQITMSGSKFSAQVLDHINTRSGLSSDFIYDLKLWNNKLWLVNEKSLNAFDPEAINYTIDAPGIYFDSITNNENQIDLNSNGDFSYDERNLRFYYCANSFKKNPGFAEYRYALLREKSDTSWEYTNSRDIQYTNLEPGNYEFVIAASNKSNKWSQSPASYSFSIQRHFLQTPIFRISFIMLVMGLGYLIYWIRSRRFIQKEIQKRKIQALEMRAQKAELDVLRGQMNPHFVYNALNSIQNYIYKGDKENANFYLTRFSKLMRNSLEMSKLELITIEEEVKFIKNYLQLEQMRFEEKFDYSINIDDTVNPRDKVPPLLVQPLVENCIKHAFKNIDYKGFIQIDFHRYSDHLSILIIDNGLGMQKEISSKPKSHRSISTTIIKERLNILNATKPDKQADLIIESTKKKDKFKANKGTIAKLILPIYT